MVIDVLKKTRRKSRIRKVDPMDAMQIVQLITLVVACMACVFLFVLFRVSTALLRYTASKITDETRGYFVTYMVVKDHDFRNDRLNIPPMERIRHGYEFRYGSELLLFNEDETPVMAPSYLKMRILNNLADRDEISRIDMFCIFPMSSSDISNETNYVAEIQRQFSADSQGTQEPNK